LNESRGALQRLRGRGFFDLTWSIFRLCMRSIFAVLSIVYLFGTVILFFLSPEAAAQPAAQFLASLGSVLLFGLVVVTYFTLLIAVPVSAVCASLALLVTGLVRLYEVTFPNPKAAGFAWPGFIHEPLGPDARVEFIESKVEAQAALCPVCASAIQGDHVSCSRCEVPHHPECWEYLGSCATFGCGSDRRAPRPGEATSAPEWWPFRQEQRRSRQD
jgi:hypothetical protein